MLTPPSPLPIAAGMLANVNVLALVLTFGGIAFSVMKIWMEVRRGNREPVASAGPAVHTCPTCGSTRTVPVRRKHSDRLDASYYLCQDCRKRSGDGVWSDAPAPEEVRSDSQGTLGKLLSVKDRVSGHRRDDGLGDPPR